MKCLITAVVLRMMTYIVLGSKSPFNEIHHLLTKRELKEIFDVERHADVPDYEIVFVRARRNEPESGQRRRESRTSTYPYLLKGEDIEMELIPNTRLISSSLESVMITSGGEEKMELPDEICHYMAYNDEGAAAVSNCDAKDPREMYGLILMTDRVLSLKPTPTRLRALYYSARKERETKGGIPHFIHRHPEDTRIRREASRELLQEEVLPQPSVSCQPEERGINGGSLRAATKRETPQAPQDLYLELAVFADKALYKKLENFYCASKKPSRKIRDLLLGYVNQIQAIYYQPSLGRKLHISLVRLELQNKQPESIPIHGGEGSALLTDFCAYQKLKNPKADKDPKHWDMALYLTALDLYKVNSTNYTFDIVGTSFANSVCGISYPCVLQEFGIPPVSEIAATTCGLASTLVAAHEMAHSLGMSHDDEYGCNPNNFIMSSYSKGRGQTNWSPCSADIMKNLMKPCLTDAPKRMSKKLDHTVYAQTPGQTWNADEQCKIFLRDNRATLYEGASLHDVCNELLCKTPNMPQHYSAGPAIDGTYCGGGKWCRYGKCVSIGLAVKNVTGGWSKWQTEGCKSACIVHSIGGMSYHRTCDEPERVNSEGCYGEASDVFLTCNDTEICKYIGRIEARTYASKRCKEFANYVSDIKEKGIQMPYNNRAPWNACTIYCEKKEEKGMYYSPKHKLRDLGIDPFFPDGTWCHKDEEINYYCVGKYCLPHNRTIIS